MVLAAAEAYERQRLERAMRNKTQLFWRLGVDTVDLMLNQVGEITVAGCLEVNIADAIVGLIASHPSLTGLQGLKGYLNTS